MQKIRWRWVGLGALATMGILAVLAGLFFLLTIFLFNVPDLDFDARVSFLGGPLAGYALAGLVVFFLAFGLGGVAAGWISPGRRVIEPVLSAVVVLVIFALAGSAVTTDVVFLAAIGVVPCAALAGIGGWIGNWLDKGRERQ
jgi:hypothetical protein